MGWTKCQQHLLTTDKIKSHLLISIFFSLSDPNRSGRGRGEAGGSETGILPAWEMTITHNGLQTSYYKDVVFGDGISPVDWRDVERSDANMTFNLTTCFNDI